MALVRHAQIEVDVPPGWEARAFSRRGAGSDLRSYSVLHLANFVLPGDVADYGGGAVERMAGGDAFISLIEFGRDSARASLFSARGVPRLRVDQFGAERLQRGLPGHSGAQQFFTAAGNAYGLYIVLAEHLLRWRTVPAVNDVLQRLRLS